MFQHKSNYCTFGNDVSKCTGYSTDAFKNIICSKHLEDIYGLMVTPRIRTNETSREIVGPYLMPAYKTSFKPNTVIFPDKLFFDKTFNTMEMKMPHEYKYSMSRNLTKHIESIIFRGKNTNSNETNLNRMHVQIIRNASVPDPLDVDTYKINDKNTLTAVQTRLANLKHTVENHVYSNLYEKVDTLDSNVLKDDPDGANEEKPTLSAFHKFVTLNMLHSFHSCDQTEPNMYAATIPPNIQYRENIGFVTLTEISNGDFLVLLGHETGTQHLYHTKVFVEHFPTKELGNKIHMGETINMHDSILSNC